MHSVQYSLYILCAEITLLKTSRMHSQFLKSQYLSAVFGQSQYIKYCVILKLNFSRAVREEIPAISCGDRQASGEVDFVRRNLVFYKLLGRTDEQSVVLSRVYRV